MNSLNLRLSVYHFDCPRCGKEYIIDTPALKRCRCACGYTGTITEDETEELCELKIKLSLVKHDWIAEVEEM